MNTLQRISALFLLIITSVITAHAAGEWIEIGEQDGERNSIYTKITTDGYRGNYVVWFLTEYQTQSVRAEVRKDAGLKRTPFSKKICIKFNSSFSEYAIVSGVFYSSKGSVIDSFEAPYEDFRQIVPGTVGEGWAEAAQYVLRSYGE